MARYIDADKLCEALKNMAAVQEPYKQNTILGVVSSIENFPTADVVPKSEVELYKRLNDELEDELAATYDKLENAKTEVAREIFEEIERLLRIGVVEHSDCLDSYVKKGYAELKKKYTERCPDCKHFVGCECFDGKTCDEYKEGKT